jgi:hypothetical protein
MQALESDKPSSSVTLYDRSARRLLNIIGPQLDAQPRAGVSRYPSIIRYPAA